MANTKKYTAEEQAIINKQKAAIAKEEGRRKQERVANRPNYTKVERPPKTAPKYKNRVALPPRSDTQRFTGTTDSDVSAPKVNRKVNIAKPNVTKPAKKSFRERRAERLQKRIASAKGEGRKGRLQKRLSRVEARMGKDEPKKTGGMGGAVPPKNKTARTGSTNKKKPTKMMGGGMMKAKGKANGGMIKAKGMKAGGKTNFPDLNKDGSITKADILKGRGVPGMKGGGMMKTKGATAGGKMKSKGYKKGGKVNKKQKVRGAGIARKGVRPAKMY